MLQKLKIPTTGAAAEIADTTLSASSGRPSIPQRLIDAGRLVDRLFGMVALPDVGDPQVFLSAAAALFAEYAPSIGEKALIEIATRSDRPTLKLMKDVLDEMTEVAQRHESREQRRRMPRIEAPKRTPEQQARIDRLVAETRRAHGLPPEGRGRENHHHDNDTKTA